MRILSGIQPTGVLHIGNYFGMMRPAIRTRGGATLTCGIGTVSSFSVSGRAVTLNLTG